MCCTCWTFSNPLYICKTQICSIVELKTWIKSTILCTPHTGTTPLTPPPPRNKSGMKTPRQLYQMTFLKECLTGEGVLGCALNSIIDNIITLCNVPRLWCRFGKVTAKPWNPAPSIQLRYAALTVSVCPENCWDLFQCNLFVWEQQEIPVYTCHSQKKQNKLLLKPETVEVWKKPKAFVS